jgi:fibronectin-binding autotransporter adhesin
LGLNARNIIIPSGGGGGGAGSVNFSAGAASANLASVVFSNSNGVSFGLNGSTITASVTPAGGAQTAISGIVVSDATYTSGTVSFSNQGNVTIGSSVNGATQYIRLSVAAQSNQSAIKGLGVSNTGQTAGNTGISTGIDWVLAGSQSITLSQSTVGGGPDTIWFQHPAWLTTAMQSNAATISNINLSGGTTSANRSNWTFADSNGISWGVNTNGSITATVATNYQSQGAYLTTADLSQNSSKYVQNWKLTGNTSGTTSSAQGTDLWFSGGNSITVSGSSNSIVFSVGNYITTQTNQSAIRGLGASNTGNTAGNTGLSTGIDWVIAGTNNITISESTVGGGPNTLWVSGAAAGGAQTAISGIVVSDTTYTSGTVSFSGQANITIGSSVNGATQYIRLSVAAQSNQSAIKGWGVSNTGNTLGNTGLSTGIDWVIAGSGGITASESTVGGGPNTVWLSVANPVAQTNQSAIKGLGVSNTGNTAGNTGISTGIDWVLAGSNGITASQSTTAGGPNTIWISGTTYPAQSNQSAIKGLGASNTGNTAGNTGLSTGIDWVIAGTGAVTVSESTTAGGPNTLWLSAPNAAAGNVTFSAGANSSGLGSVIFSNSNGVSFGLGAGSVITASVVGGGGVGIGITNSGNTAGTSGTVTTGNYYLVGSGAITLSQSSSGNNGTLTITVPATSSLVGTNGISVSTNGSTISIYPAFQSSYENVEFGGMNSIMSFNQSSALSHAVAFNLPYPVSASFLRVPVTMSTNSTTIATLASATATASAAMYSTVNAVVYSLGVAGNSQSLQSVASGSAGFTFSQNISITNSSQYSISQGFSAQANGAGTTRTTQYSISNTNYSFTTNQIATEWSGARMLDIPFANSLTWGPYWLIVGISSSSASGGAGLGGMSNCHVRYSGHLGFSATNLSFGIMGSTNMTSGGLLGCGSFSTAGGGTTNSLPVSAISSIASNAHIYFQLLRSA